MRQALVQLFSYYFMLFNSDINQDILNAPANKYRVGAHDKSQWN